MVEVTLAIGITAVALVSLMGMLPKGMQTLQKANDQAIMGRIHQQLLGELQLTPWESASGGDSPIDAFNGMTRIYDDQGIELPANRMGEFEHVYTARITIPRAGGGTPTSVGGGTFVGVKVPGEEELDEGSPDDHMRLVLVEVTSVVDPDFDTIDPRNVETYRTVIAKMGQDFGSND